MRSDVQAAAQTADGYLWLGSAEGLLRFDGARIKPWNPPSGALLPTGVISSLLATKDGGLWIGTRNGLASWRAGRLTNYPALTGLEIEALLEDRDGTVWVGAWGRPTGRLCAIRNGATSCEGTDGSLGDEAISLYEDADGRLWVAATTGLWRWKPGPPVRYASIAIDDRQALTRSLDGSGLTFVERGTVRQFNGGKSADLLIPGAPAALTPTSLLWDRSGGLWIGTSARGLVYLSQGHAHFFTHQDGLSSDTVFALLEDREGTVWATTARGIDSLRPVPVSSLSTMDGLSSDSVRSVLAARDGSIWVGTGTGLNRWHDGRLRIYRRHTDPGLPGDEIEPLAEDALGRLWVAGRSRGAAMLQGDRFVPVPAVPKAGITAISADGGNGLWVSVWSADGLIHLLDGKVVERIAWDRLGGEPASGLIADSDGAGVWVGLLSGGIAHVRAGEIRKISMSSEGTVIARVLGLARATDGALWVPTEGGLGRLSDEKLTLLTSANDLPCNTVHWAVEDRASDLWLDTACGLLRISASDLHAWIADSAHKVSPMVLDPSDGVELSGVLNYARPVVARADDGRLWFENGSKVGVIDPTRLPVNARPPPVYIESITADGKQYAPSSALRLPPLIRDLSIDYTALSLAVPQKVRFRYRLEGQDPAWREVVNDRTVQYSNLAPGNYRFRVLASNNSGVWNEAGATLDLTITPAYWQTTAFRVACGAAVLALLWLLYRLRLRQVSREFELTLDARVAERTRIARELHDTLLQSFNGLLMRLHAVSQLVASKPSEAKRMLDSSIDLAADAVKEGRQALQGLRGSLNETSDLPLALTTLGDVLAAERPDVTMGLSVEVQGPVCALHPVVRDEVFQIAREALRNAFAHSGGTQIEVELRYGTRSFRLLIRDDGRGLSSPALEQGRQGHFGLRGMRERAEEIGGRFTIWSAPGAGTEIELTIPATRAYVTAPAQPGSAPATGTATSE